MIKNLEKKYQSLISKLKVLEEENKLLTERSEEIILLGLVSKSVDLIEDKHVLLENVLERISILKNIPLCSFYTIHKDSLKLICTYTKFSEDHHVCEIKGLSQSIVEDLNDGPYTITKESFKSKGFSVTFDQQYFHPYSAVILSCKSRYFKNGIFVFLDDDQSHNRLSPMINLLQQIVSMVIEKLDKISLIEQINKMNAELERKITERTLELRQINKELQKEIKERKQIEIDLKESEERFRRLSDSTLEGIAISEKGKILDINKRLLDMLGYGIEDIEGIKALDLVAPESRKKVEHKMKTAYEGVYEHLAMKKDGTIFPVEVEGKTIPYKNHSARVTIIRDITERKQAEEKLRISEEQFRLTFEKGPIGIHLISPTFHILKVNNAFCNLLGYTEKELVGLPLSDILHPDDVDKGMELARKLRDGEIQNIEIERRYITKDKKNIWTNNNASVVRDSIGNVLYGIGIVENITERKQTEEFIFNIAKGVSAATGEMFFRSLVSHIANALEADYAFIGELKKDNPNIVQTIAVYAQGQKADNFEYDLENTPCANVIGESLCAYPQDVQKLFPLDQLLIDMGVEAYVGSPLIDSNGHFLGIFCVLYKKALPETTRIKLMLQIFSVRASAELERIRAEKKIRDNEQKLLLHIEKTPMAVIDWDTNLNVMAWNPAAEKIFGYTKKQALGKNAKDLIIPESAKEQINVVWADLLKNIGGTRSINENHTKDGKTIICDWYNTPLVDEKGQVFGVTSLVDDITIRTEAVDQLRQSEEKFHSLFDDAINMINIIDTEGFILDANKAHLEKLGYAKEELIGKNITEILDLGSVDKNKIEIREALQENTIGSGLLGYETVLLTKTGERLIVESNVTPQIVNGKVVAYRGILTDITDRKILENTLKESEFLLKESQRVASLGSYVLNITTGTWTCSDVLDDIFGIDIIFKKDLNGWLQIVHPEHQDEMQAYFTKNILTEHQPFNKEYKILRLRDNVEVWVHGLGELEYDADGNPIKMIGTIQDITARKHTEKALMESERKYRFLFDNALVGIGISYQDGKVLAANETMCRITGYSIDELREVRPADTFVNPNDRKKLLEFISKKGQAENFEVQLYNKNMEKYWSALSVKPIRFENQDAVLTTTVDITERKSVEEEIRKLSQSVEQSPASVIITDLEGNIEYVNQKFIDITGYSIKEIVGKNPRILNSGKTTHSEYKRLWDTITSGEVWTGEFQNKKKNGELYSESASISPIKNDNDDISHFVAVKEDITERKQLQSQLSQTQKMEAVGQLAGGIAHDFNNLLTIINGYAELVLMNLEPGNSMYKDIREILESGEKASDLTRRLLTFSRMQPIIQKILDINIVIKNLDKMIRRLIGEDIIIKKQLLPKLPLIKADLSQLEQILMNLIINARDAVNEKADVSYEKKIIIKTDKVSFDKLYVDKYPGCKPGSYVQLSVKDNGIGMDEATIKKIFEPFYTTKEAGKGTGLGLSTVYGIIKQNNGFVYVDSIPGSETTFKVLWPLSKEQIILDDNEKSIKDSYTGNEVILLVEDDEGVRNFASLTLKKFGYKVFKASTGSKALKLVKDNNINLLITDMIMPEMNGKELAAKIKKLIPGIKILYMSGYIDDPIIRSSLTDKKINFIDKPFSVNKFAEKVRKILN